MKNETSGNVAVILWTASVLTWMFLPFVLDWIENHMASEESKMGKLFILFGGVLAGIGVCIILHSLKFF